ncbi:MAG TPA: amidase [Actinomycetes bacterium]|jgi:aspartyl-tRNA(Asn)/glutamyl-tRNA(Gln) amidotransferase subunit A|nr:amidase [Actinomycetes bacterium]
MTLLEELSGRAVAEVAAAVDAGELDARELTEAHLERLAANAHLRAVITVCAEQALVAARAGPRGPLAGVPLVVKDLFDTAGIRTTYGSAIFTDHVPERTAPTVSRLTGAGAVLLAKANLHEFAWGLTSQNRVFGQVVNPRDPALTPGGSSGGNGAALAAGIGMLGLGTDSGGSVRVPAACCGIVGFKPAHGALPLDGVWPLAPSYDTVGPMARTVRDAVTAMRVLAGGGFEPAPWETLRVGAAPGDPAGERLAGMGARVVEAELPGPEADLLPAFAAECAATHQELYRRRPDDYTPNLRAKLDAALALDAATVDRARAARRRWRDRLRAGLDVDVLVGPTLGAPVPPADCDELEIREALGARARVANALGWPAIAVGDVQFMGPRDQDVIALALAWERSAP